MANYECSACEDLRQNAPDFVLNGIGDDECENLAKNGGLSGDSDDCTDLHDINDCLVGFMENELPSYDTCDWKTFMKKFIPNVWTTFKAIICSICGLWCMLSYSTQGETFEIGEEETDGAYAVAGKGVTFMEPGEGEEHTSDLRLLYIAGGLVHGSGSYRFYDTAFTDAYECWNFDNGDVVRQTTERKGNKQWGKDNYRLAKGGELICEFRINKSVYPQIGSLYSGLGQETGGGAYHVQALVFDGDNVPEGQTYKYAFGQHGWCDEDGTKSESDYDDGHIVPAGWIYVQLRMTYCIQMGADGNKYSPRYWMGMRVNPSGTGC